MAFERFARKGTKGLSPRVSIMASRQINISGSAIDKYFSKAEYVNLYFHKDNFAVGIKCVEKGMDNSFKLTRNRINSTSYISAHSFLKYYGIDNKSTKRYVPTWSDKDGMLVVKMDKS